MATLVTEQDCRLFFLMIRDLLDRNDHLSHFHKWLAWNSQPELARIVRRFEGLSADERSELRRALSGGQMESKLWLLDLMKGVVVADRPLSICVVGGWCGLMPLLISLLKPFPLAKLTQVDLNQQANAIAERLNWSSEKEIRFQALTGDALDFNYQPYQIIINTCCEHFTAEKLSSWLEALPSSRYVFLQSNNFFSEPGHVNCYPDMYAFRKSVNIRSQIYCGERDMDKYRRFMVAGITHYLRP